MLVCLLILSCFYGYIGRKEMKMEIRTHTPDSKSITLLVIRDKDGKAVSYVSISGSSTLVTIEQRGYTVKEITENRDEYCDSRLERK